MKDQIQENLTILYKEYCDYISNNAKDYRDHDTYTGYKNSLIHFMQWLNNGIIDDFK